MKRLVKFILCVWVIALTTLKLAGVIAWSWWFILFPVILWFVLWVVIVICLALFAGLVISIATEGKSFVDFKNK